MLAVRLTPEERSSRWYPGAKESVEIRTEVRNGSPRAARLTLETAILDANGKQAGFAQAPVEVGAGASATVEQALPVASPRHWFT